MTNSLSYAFRPVTTDDLTVIRSWLDAPEVRPWWGDPVIEFTLIRQDLADPDVDQIIVSFDGRPFAFVQHYVVDATPSGKPLPAGTRAIDTFIGETDMLGAGHGARYLREFANALFADGTPSLVVDPDPENNRAVATYEKAGFVNAGAFETPEGAVLLMQLSP